MDVKEALQKAKECLNDVYREEGIEHVEVWKRSYSTAANTSGK